MEVVSVGEVKNGFLECLNFTLHLVGLDVRLELRKVIDCALAVGGGNNICGILANVFGNFAPGSFDGSDGVS